MNIFLGYFDIAILIGVLAFNLMTKNRDFCSIAAVAFTVVIFGFFLPVLSITVEIDRVTSEREVLDNFTLLYTYFRFPIYWLVGAIQIGYWFFRRYVYH